ncbi:uncharacterized protein LOC130992817 isoform X2 [Salvia miltiorrhiza]|nr:uncharacterized protein LOC130992817 isoform X2 [Salvia miltiorrhiza]
MNAGAATTAALESTSASSDEMAAKAANKRYEGLVTVRTKAIKGKGAWYWAHLEPILVNSSDTGLPKAVKLRCSLCDAVFSASNPSRTASEHLKRGTCPNFASAPNPISSLPPSSSSSVSVAVAVAASPPSSRKRASSSSAAAGNNATTTSSTFPPPLAIVDPSRFTVDLAYPPHSTSLVVTPAAAGHQQQLVLSGGKEDLGALAMLEDSVKRLKSPKASPAPALSKSQVDSALDFLADWVYECCGSVSLSSLDHPKFKSFLNQVGLPPISKREFATSRLDAKYEEARADCEAKIRDAMFFQLAAHGWNNSNENLLHLSVNLPNGTSLFKRAVFTSGYVHTNLAEEILWDTITDICGGGGGNVQQCVGIVSDKFKGKALRNLEAHHPWMVNLCCQCQSFTSLIKDLGRELHLFKNVTTNCMKIANLINNKSQIRHTFHKFQVQEYGHAAPLRVSDFAAVVEDILSSARALHLMLTDESYKMLSMEEQLAREVEEMMRNPRFWNELEAVHSLVKLIKTMSNDVEEERPRIGQCLPLWEELRAKVKEWCAKFQILQGPVEKVVERRFEKNYHPAWAAAFVLDPLYLIRDASGKYLPPFKCLSSEQEKDVDRLITRLVSREEAHVALMELMKWRTEGLDPMYAQAVQLRQRDAATGKMKIANPQSSRLVWEAHLTDFKSLGKVAVRLIFLHATSSSSSSAYTSKCSLIRHFHSHSHSHSHSRAGMDTAQKLMFISAHSISKHEHDHDHDHDQHFALPNGEDDVLDEVFVDSSSV